MKKSQPQQKLEIAVQALQRGPKIPIRELARKYKVSPQSVYTWADELQAAANVVFGSTRLPKNFRSLHLRNKLLRERVDVLTTALLQAGVAVPDLKAGDLDPEDAELLEVFTGEEVESKDDV